MDYIVVCEENTHCYQFMNDALDKIDEYMQEGKTPSFIDLTQSKTYFYPELDTDPLVKEIEVFAQVWDDEDDD